MGELHRGGPLGVHAHEDDAEEPVRAVLAERRDFRAPRGAAAARGGQVVVAAVAAGEQVLDIEAGSRWRRTRPARASSACQPRPAAMGGDQAAVWTKRAEQASSVRGTSLQRKPNIGVG